MRAFLATLSLALFITAPALAEDVDTRWQPWLGCWQLTLASYDYDDERPEGEVFVCLSPRANDMGVGITTWVDGTVQFSETLVADGSPYPVEESECEGWRSAEWSGDGERLFMHSELTCENDTARTVSGVSMMVPGSTWVDIQMIASGYRKELVIRRYRRADREAEEAGLADALEEPWSSPVSPLTMEDIIEASRDVDGDVLEAILVESDTRLHVDSESLVRLADSDVPRSIIDLMVALSYPAHFEVNSRQALGGGGGGLMAVDDFLYGGAYDPYSYWYPFYFAPFGYYSYAYWSRPYGGYYLLTGDDDVKPADSGGKVVKGEGYTRVWPKKKAAQYGGSMSSGSGWASSSDGSSSSSGYSKGSGSRSTGRTAKPKNKK
jgi:hypothetical protein